MMPRKIVMVLGLVVATVLADLACAGARDDQHQEDARPTVAITLTDAGYEPAAIEIRAGETVLLAISNEAESSCATSVVSKELGIPETELPKGETVVVEVTPRQPGEYTFACAMGMVKGSVLVKGS
jgi:plastocyanin domain-containing protein